MVQSQSISLSKLAGLMDMDVTSLRSQLMLLKQVHAASGPACLTDTPPMHSVLQVACPLGLHVSIHCGLGPSACLPILFG